MAKKSSYHFSTEAIKQNFFILLLSVTCLFSIAIGEYILFSSMGTKKINTLPTPQPTATPIPLGTQRACTLEAKLCPNGNYVGRTGPNCEFTPCPK